MGTQVVNLRLIPLAVLVTWSIVVHAQPPSEILDNNAIISLSKAGLSKALIINKIKTSNCRFDLSSQGLVALKKDSVDEDVILEMMQRRPYMSLSANDSAGQADRLMQNFPGPGIYYFDTHRGKYIQLDASPVSGSRPDLFYAQASNAASVGTNMATTYSSSALVDNVVSNVPLSNLVGNGQRNKFYLDGKEANIESDTSLPVFYFYVNNEAASPTSAPSDYFSRLIASAASGDNATRIMPRDFTLYQLQTTKNQRFFTETTIKGAATPIISSKTIVTFRYEKLFAGLYKISCAGPLKEGEYCFLFIGGDASRDAVSGFYKANTPRVFDFGVRK